jgi:hypothetical protein
MFNIFGNRVKIISTPETIEKGVAGKIGVIYGYTTPSITGVQVIGNPKEDFALNVLFEELNITHWFNEDLLQHIDDGQGVVMTLDGIDKKWTKGKKGEWFEEDTKLNSTKNKGLKKWWQFWK